jgi:hydroxypyruvate reductase
MGGGPPEVRMIYAAPRRVGLVATRSRKVLVELWNAALAAVDPKAAVERALASRAVASALARGRRVGVFSVGKAAAAMASAVDGPGPRLTVVPRGYASRIRTRGRVLRASHPEPDHSSVRAARAALAFFRGFDRGDVILCLISGGASSLLCLPKPGVSLAEKRGRVRRLMDDGASIVEINALRTRLSAVKGGRLGRATKARLVTLVLSDVPGDRPALVGSGPTIRRRKGDIVRVVARNRDGLEAAARRAREMGLKPQIRRQRISSEALVEGGAIGKSARTLSAGGALLAGGESVVTRVPGEGFGRGGRSLELAVSTATYLEGYGDLALLAAGSDGIDGNSRAAGAFVDGTTQRRGWRRGRYVGEVFREHNSASYFRGLGDLFTPGPTGTNVGDWVFVLREKP